MIFVKLLGDVGRFWMVFWVSLAHRDGTLCPGRSHVMVRYARDLLTLWSGVIKNAPRIVPKRSRSHRGVTLASWKVMGTASESDPESHSDQFFMTRQQHLDGISTTFG